MKTGPIRLLIFAHNHPDLTAGGAERAAYSLFQFLQSDPDYKATFVAPVDDTGRPECCVQSHRGRSDELLCRFPPCDPQALDFSTQSPQGLHQVISTLMDALEPDIVHLHHFLGIGLDVIDCIKHVRPNVKVILTLHEYLLLCHNSGSMTKVYNKQRCFERSYSDCARCFPSIHSGDFFLREQYIREKLGRCDLVHAPSQFLADQFHRNGFAEIPITVLENVQPFALESEVEARKDGFVRVSYFGQLNRFKGVDVFQRAVQEAQRRGLVHLHFSLYGSVVRDYDATFYDDFMAWVQENSAICSFHGAYSGDEVIHLMQKTDIVVVPSVWWENSPLVIQEAFSAGAWVLGADIGGVREKVAERSNGVLFRAGDPFDLLAKIVDITHNVDDGRRHVVAEDSRLRNARNRREYQRIYTDLVATGSHDQGGGNLAPAHLTPSSQAFETLTAVRRELEDRGDRLPKISLITPVYNSDPALLHELVDAVIGQVYGNWELCLANDGSPAAYVKPMLQDMCRRDARIKVVELASNGGISAATNAAAGMATGDVLAFLDHDDLITPYCTAELAIYYADHPQADVVYSDDDKIDMSGRHSNDQYKPDWSPVLMLSYMYLGHILSVKKSLFVSLGGYKAEFDGAQDYEFFLRASDVTRHIGHITKVLYHWRAVPGSTAVSAEAKPYSLEAGRRAVEETVNRRQIKDATVIYPDWAKQAGLGIFDIRFPHTGPEVCLIIKATDTKGLARCLTSLSKTHYTTYKILIIDDNNRPVVLDLSAMSRVPISKVDPGAGHYNLAQLYNLAAATSQAPYLLFLSQDTDIVDPDWLSQMMGYGQMTGVGAVSPKISSPAGTIRYAGIFHGYRDGLFGHAFKDAPSGDLGYMYFIQTPRECAAVTATCLLTSQQSFLALGGFDETQFSAAYIGVDYSYRLVCAGQTCIYCANGEIVDVSEPAGRDQSSAQDETNFRKLYGGWKDRWHNPRLSVDSEHYSLGNSAADGVVRR